MLILGAFPIVNEYKKSHNALAIYNMGVRYIIGVITHLILPSEFSS